MKHRCLGVLCIGLLLGLSLVMVGCSANEQKENDKINVVTTLFAAYDFARQTGGEYVNVSMLLKPGAEAHSYEPTPRDIVNIGKCDVFICNGGENETWVETILEATNNPNMIVVRMVDCCEGLEEELKEGMQEAGVLAELFEHEEISDEEEEEWDEHVWMSPINAAKIAQEICNAYCVADKANESAYRAMTEEYVQKLSLVNEKIKASLGSEERLLVFADRFPARYFVEEYGIDYRAAFSGCSANTQASAATVAYIIDLVKDKNIKTVYTMELSDGRLASAVAEETGAVVKTFYTGHNVTLEDFESGITYIDLLNRDLEAIIQ